MSCVFFVTRWRWSTTSVLSDLATEGSFTASVRLSENRVGQTVTPSSPFLHVGCAYSNCCIPLGVRGTYQGLTATVLKQGTNQAIRFYVMNLLRNWYKGEKKKSYFSGSCSLKTVLPFLRMTPSFVSLRWRPQKRNAPNCDGDVWGHGGRCQCLWKHAPGCGKNQDAGKKHSLFNRFDAAYHFADFLIDFFCRV